MPHEATCTKIVLLNARVLSPPTTTDSVTRMRPPQAFPNLGQESEIRAHGVQDDLLGDDALLTDLQRESDTSSQAPWQGNFQRLHKGHDWLPKSF